MEPQISDDYVYYFTFEDGLVRSEMKQSDQMWTISTAGEFRLLVDEKGEILFATRDPIDEMKEQFAALVDKHWKK